MRPSLCIICYRDVREQHELEYYLLKFKDYQPLPSDMVGHPKWLEWFCQDHIGLAKWFTHLNTEDAVKEIAKYYN